MLPEICLGLKEFATVAPIGLFLLVLVEIYPSDDLTFWRGPTASYYLRIGLLVNHCEVEKAGRPYTCCKKVGKST